MQTPANTEPAAGGLLAPTRALDRFQHRVGVFAERTVARADQTLRHGFRVGTLRLLIAERTGSELAKASEVVPIPRTPAFLLGVMNLRGQPVPVFDLRVALGLPAKEGARGLLVLVLDKGERAAGIEIDEYPAALRGLQRASAVPSLPVRLAPFAAAAWVGQGALWIDFEHRGFFESLSGASAR